MFVDVSTLLFTCCSVYKFRDPSRVSYHAGYGPRAVVCTPWIRRTIPKAMEFIFCHIYVFFTIILFQIALSAILHVANIESDDLQWYATK